MTELVSATSARGRHVLALLAGIKSAALTSNDVVRLLDLGHLYGRLLWANSVGIYREDAFEAALIPLVHDLVPSTVQASSARILHVVSTPYKFGGHTRLMERLCKFEPELSDVLITRPFQDDGSTLRLPTQALVYHQEHGYDLDRLVAVMSVYQTVCLHIHPDDLQAAVAVGVAKFRTGCRVIFVNHADHVFSFGVRSADVIAEVSTFGLALSCARRGAPSGFLGIALDNSNFSPIGRPSGRSCQIMAAAAPYKFKPSNGYSFPQLAMAVLSAIPDARLTVIGPKISNRWWWLVRLRFPKRLKLYPVLPYEQYLALVREADVYLDSLPMTGGTAVPEVRAQGVAVTGLQTGALGYTPFDQAKLASSAELLAALSQFLSGAGGAIAESNNAPALLALAQATHAPDEVGRRFQSILQGEALPQAIMPTIDHDLSFYERMWQKENTFILDRNAKRLVLLLIVTGSRSLLRPLLGAATGWQAVRLFFAYLRLALRA